MKVKSLFVVVGLMVLATTPTLAQDAMLAPPSTHTACAEGVDLSGQEFRINHFGDFTGPLGFITTPLLAALEDAVNYYNAAGGVCGATITLPDPTTIDTGGVPSVSEELYNRFSTAESQAQFAHIYILRMIRKSCVTASRKTKFPS